MIRELLKENSEGLLRLPTDKVLVEDPVFRPFVELYAKVIQGFLRSIKTSFHAGVSLLCLLSALKRFVTKACYRLLEFLFLVMSVVSFKTL